MTLHIPPRRSILATCVCVLAVMLQREAFGNGVTAPLTSDDITIRPEVVVRAMKKVVWRQPFIPVSMAQRSDKSVRGTHQL